VWRFGGGRKSLQGLGNKENIHVVGEKNGRKFR
jgi:hypothetical protein